MWNRSRGVWAAIAVFSLTATGAVAAPAADAAAATVLTRARVASFLDVPGGKSYVRLKLMPRSKLPFTTQTFRVTDPSLLAGIAEGSTVKFSAKHIEGESVVTAMQVVAECVRFQPCD